MLSEDPKNEHKRNHKPTHPQFRSLFVDENNFCFLNHISPLSAQVLSSGGCDSAKDPGTDAAYSADDESASSFVLLSCSPEAQQQQRSQQSHIHANNVKPSLAPPNDHDYYLTLQQQKYNAKLSSGDLQIDTIGYGSSQLLNCSSSGGGAGQSSTTTASILSSDATAASSLLDANELWSNGAKSRERAWSKILLPEHVFFDIPELEDHYSSLLDDTASLHRQRSLAEDDDHDPFHPNKQHTHHHHPYAAYNQRPATSFASTGAPVSAGLAAAADKHTPQILVESHLLSECIRSLGSSPDATAACPTTTSSSTTPSTHNDSNNNSIGNGDRVKNAEFFIPVDLERQGQHNKASDKDNNSTNGTTTSLDRSTAAASHNAKNINKSSAYNATGQENRSLMKDLALSLDAAASRYASQNFGVRGGVVRSSLSQEIKNSSLKNSYYHIQSALQKQPKRDEKTNCEFNLSSNSAVTLKTSKEFPPNCSTQSYLPTRNSVDRPQNLKQLDCCPAAVSELNKFSTALSNPTATNNNQLQHLAASKAPNLLTCDNCRQNLNTSPNQNQQRLPNPSSTNSSCNHQISSETKSITQQPKLYSYCTFCKNNGESEAIYSTHYLKDSNGVVTCPILRAYTCPICGQNGDKAHTVKYCPIAARLSPKEAPVRSEMRVLRTARTSAGRRRFY